MSRVEELPDDFDESLNLNSSSTPTSIPLTSKHSPSQQSAGIPTTMSQSASPFPAKPQSSDPTLSIPSASMPPGMASTKQYTTDELLAELNRSPLFMTSIDDAENPALDALKALAYEGTKAEVAGNFREQGNECARAKKWVDAREFYDKALAVIRHGVPKPETRDGRLDGKEGPAEVDWVGNGEDGQAEEEVDEEEERGKERGIEEACYVNRALCSLELKNYGSCTRDCASALGINPRNIKALYRTSLALHALQKLDLAHDACTLLLSIDPANTAAQALLKRIDTAITTAENVKRDREAREAKIRAKKATLVKAIKDRGWQVKMTASAPVDAQDAEIKLEDENDAASTISVPVLLLYPTAAQSELVKAIAENETIADHLEYILPDAPWDENREFQEPASVECYMETKEGGLIKVGRKVILGKVLAGGKIEIKDGLCRVFVVPKKRVNEWIEEFKKRRGTS